MLHCKFHQLIIVFVHFFIVLVCSADAARILGFFPSHSKSHLIIHCAIANTLTETGHDVTVIGTIPNVNKKAKYKFIHLDVPVFAESLTGSLINNPKTAYQHYLQMLEEMKKTANFSLLHPTMQKFLRDNEAGSFDLLILGYFMNDFQLGLGAHFQCPIVVSFMVQPLNVINSLIGNPPETSYVPLMLSKLKQPLNFWGRVLNYLLHAMEEFLTIIWFNRDQQQLYNFHFPSHRYPPLDEVKKNVSLVLTNHHFASQGPVRPNVPALIEIGGIQIKDTPDPLPSDLQEILDNATNGAIYFSLGSKVNGTILTKDRTKIMFNVLSQLPYKVLWKWGESDFPGESKNIIYKSWLPQDDILAHPNVKLFITHCGQGSVVESQYHGVPMVGMPLFGDQHANAKSIIRSGFGVNVDYATLTEESFRNNILEATENPKYAKAVKEFSVLYRDRPMKPRDAVHYWINYVLRYKGAKHLQSPAVYLNDWQLNLWDVFGFIWVAVALVIFIFIGICKVLCCHNRPARKMGKEIKLKKKK